MHGAIMRELRGRVDGDNKIENRQSSSCKAHLGEQEAGHLVQPRMYIQAKDGPRRFR